MGMTDLWRGRFRFLVLAVGGFCLLALSSNAIVFNMVVVCMASDANSTVLSSFPPVDYTQYQITQANWALGLGTALSTVPFSEIYSRIGAKYPFFGACILSSLSTAFMPFAAEWSFWALLVLRVAQGVGFASIFAAVGLLTAKWSTLEQSGLFISLITMYAPGSMGVTNVLSGIVCDSSMGWPSVYYMHAIMGLSAALLWLVFYDDNPMKSSRVSVKELNQILKGKCDQELDSHDATPYVLLLKDPIIWSIWFNGFMEVFSTNYLAVYVPLYFRYALGFSVDRTGYYSGVGRIMQIPSRLFAGFFSSKFEGMSVQCQILLFNTIALSGGGLSCVLLGLAPTAWPFLGVLCFGLMNLTTGVCSCGYLQSAVLYTRHHSHFVLAVVLFTKCVNLFVGPLLTALLVPDMDAQSEWAIIFIGIGVLMIAASAVFFKFHGAEPAEYVREKQRITVSFPPDALTMNGTLKTSSV